MTNGDDARRLDEQLKRAEVTAGALAHRLAFIETTLWRVGLVCGFVGLLLGLVLPFLVAADDDEVETITLIPAIFASSADSDDGGPFSGEAALLSFLLGLLAVGTVLMAGVLLALADRRVSETGLRVCRFVAVLYLIGVLGTWPLVMILAARADSLDAFSPATVGLTVAAVIGTWMVFPGSVLVDTERHRGRPYRPVDD